jgi:hypothetical protein
LYIATLPEPSFDNPSRRPLQKKLFIKELIFNLWTTFGLLQVHVPFAEVACIEMEMVAV